MMSRIGTTIALFFALLFLATPACSQFGGQATWGGVAGGTANAQTVAIANISSLSQLTGIIIGYSAPSGNTGAATLAVSGTAATAVLKPSPGGLVPLTGGELFSSSEVFFDGTEYVLLTNYTNIAPLKISSNLTLFLSASGSDSNNCLTSGTPCLTLQHAWNLLVSSFNLNGFSATLKLADGTYTSGLLVSTMPAGVVSANQIILNGDSTTPSNVVINTPSAICVAVQGPASLYVENLEMTSSGTSLLLASNAGSVTFTNVIFGASGGAHINSQYGGSIVAAGNYSIVGSALSHWEAADGGNIAVNNTTVTLTGTPAFSAGFAAAGAVGVISAVSDTFSGSATGARYSISGNSVIYTSGASTSYLPGSSGGSANNGGVYY